MRNRTRGKVTLPMVDPDAVRRWYRRSGTPLRLVESYYAHTLVSRLLPRPPLRTLTPCCVGQLNSRPVIFLEPKKLYGPRKKLI